jgi:hypothetical protein
VPRRRRWSSAEVRRLAEATGSAVAGRYLAVEANSTAFEVGPSLRFGMTAKKSNKNKNGEENSRATAGLGGKSRVVARGVGSTTADGTQGCKLCPTMPG